MFNEPYLHWPQQEMNRTYASFRIHSMLGLQFLRKWFCRIKFIYVFEYIIIITKEIVEKKRMTDISKYIESKIPCLSLTVVFYARLAHLCIIIGVLAFFQTNA